MRSCPLFVYSDHCLHALSAYLPTHTHSVSLVRQLPSAHPHTPLQSPALLRYRLDSGEPIEPAPPVGFTARMRLWSARQWKNKRPDNSLEQVVQPPVHGGGMLKVHNIATLLFWLACCVVLLDSHVPSWPLNKVLTKALTKKGASGPTMPVWGLMALVYVGLWVLHWVSGAVADALPSSFSRLLSVARKDSRRAAEHYFPYGGSRQCVERECSSARDAACKFKSKRSCRHSCMHCV